MLLALGRLRPPCSEIMVLDTADSPAVSSSASPKNLLFDTNVAGASGTEVSSRPSTSTSIASSHSGSSSDSNNNNSNNSNSNSNLTTSASNSATSSVLASAPLAVAVAVAGKPVLHFRGADSVCSSSSSGPQSEGEEEGDEDKANKANKANKAEGRNKKARQQEEHEEQQQQLRAHHQDNSNSPSFVLGDVHGWADSDSDTSPCCSSPGSLSLSNVKTTHRSRHSNTFHLINSNNPSNSHSSNPSVADFVPFDRIEEDLEVQDCSPSENASELGPFLVPGQSEARRRMVERSQQCVVCMETKEHTFVPVHRQMGALQCQGHRFCSDCWIEFLQHRFRQYFAKQTTARGPMPLPCPVCRSEIYVPDCWGTQCTLPKCWRESPESSSVRVEELGSTYIDLDAQRSGAPAEFASFGSIAMARMSSNSSMGSPKGRKPLMQAWQPEPPVFGA